MKIGTRSVLFGVHQFLWHPWTVYRAYCYLYGPPTTWTELLAILLHDTPGYWGAADMDGPEGKHHPYRGARWVGKIVRFFGGSVGSACEASFFTATHSRYVAREMGLPPSILCWADKASVLFDPPWFYLLRGRLSGEIREFKQHAIDSGHIRPGATDREWLQFYREHVRNNPEIAKLL